MTIDLFVMIVALVAGYSWALVRLTEGKPVFGRAPKSDPPTDWVAWEDLEPASVSEDDDMVLLSRAPEVHVWLPHDAEAYIVDADGDGDEWEIYVKARG